MSSSPPASTTTNYNSRMSSCPGYASSGLRGYIDLLSLQTDLLEYHASFAKFLPSSSSSPSVSFTPTSDTRAPSLDPTYTHSPSIFTYSPTERVTRRPSPFPTSDIRQPLKPTMSPAPTITMAIYNGGKNGTTAATALGGSDTEDDDQGLNLLPEEPGTIGFNGTLPSDLNITTTNSNTSTTTTATATTTAFGDDTFSTSGVPSLSPAPSSSSPSFINSLGTRTTMERGGDYDNSEIGNTLDDFFIQDRLLPVVQAQPLRQRQPTLPSTTSATAAAAEKVSFPICPNTVLSFEGDSSPIILETQPARNNLIEISCIIAPGQETTTTSSSSGTRSCVMSGGNVHMLIKYIPGYNTMMMPEEDGMTSNTTVPSAAGATTETAALDGEANDQNNSNSITISGITFRDASQTSVLMNDPRGKIYFKDCAWENNSGETTVLINGRYNSTSSALLGSQEGEEVGVELGLNLIISTTSSTVNFANFVLTTTATSFTTTPMIDADATVSPFQIANDDDQMMLATISPPKKDENSRRQLFLIDDEGNDNFETSRQTEDDSLLHRTRLLVADDTPLSSISIDSCVFSGNKGNSTIAVSSNFEEMLAAEQDLGSLDTASTTKFAHWIHVAISGTSFTMEAVMGAIIDNYGGRLQLSSCTYANNTAESMVKSEYGTVAMSSTKFETNNIRGDAGVVVLDSESSLELNEGNCDAAASSTSNRCGGIDYGGVCIAFDSCDTETNETTLEVVEDGGSCFSDWDELVVAVRDRPNNEIDFSICPGASLIATTTPVVITANGITIQCGTSLSPSKNCYISGGYSHFHVEGSSSGVQLARLSMSASTGSSIMGVGTSDASLTIRDCEFIANEGSTVIVINNGESMSSSTSSVTAGTANAAMSMEVVNSTFARNELSFGTIANNGGALSVYNSRFVENSGTGGNIVVMKRGTCNVKGCCFGLSSSAIPGTIFAEEGSVVIGNENNFGSENTAGGQMDGSTCFDIFQEAKEADCLNEGSSKCAGSCKEFTASTCRLDYTGEDENSTAIEDISVPAFNKDGGSLSSKIVPITVATVVCVIIVFGIIGIIMRRRKSNGRRPQRQGTSRREYGGVDDDDSY